LTAAYGAGRSCAVPTPPPPPFSANAVRFDGTNDFLTRGAGFTGASDNKTGLVSFWFNLKGGDAVIMKIMEQAPGQIEIQRQADNKIFHRFQGSGGLAAWNGNTTQTFLSSGTWIHYLLSFDAAAGVRQLYIADNVETVLNSVENDTTADWTGTDWGIGAAPAGGLKLNSDVAEFYMTNEFLDLSVVANRRKFIDAVAKPVDLGTDGSTPTGTKPLVFFSGATVAWHTNKGSGGGFTENGALTDGFDSPSD